MFALLIGKTSVKFKFEWWNSLPFSGALSVERCLYNDDPQAISVVIISSGGSFSTPFSHAAKGQCQCFGSFATQNISLSLSYPNCSPSPWPCEPLDTRPVLDWALNALRLPHFSQTPCSCSHCGGRRSAPPLSLQASRWCPALGWLHISEGVCPAQWLAELRQAFHKGKVVAELNAWIPSQGADLGKYPLWYLPSCSRSNPGPWY